MFLLVLGYLFVSNGRVRITIIDKRAQCIVVSKHPLTYYLTCCRRIQGSKVALYPLEDVRNVRACMRGIKQGSIDTSHYKIVLDFENGDQLAILETHN